jgi:protein required for attachment to host cells
MSPVLVVVTDGAKAHFFTLKMAEIPEYESSPYLLEDEVLVNSDRDLSGQQLWSGPESQAGHYQEGNGPAHSYDDHRQDHEMEFERRFAQEIAAEILNRNQAHQAQQLILIAEHRLLGLLREVLIPDLPKTLKLSELDKNLCHLTAQDLQEYLANKDLLPKKTLGHA